MQANSIEYIVPEHKLKGIVALVKKDLEAKTPTSLMVIHLRNFILEE